MEFAVVVVTWNCADAFSSLIESMNLRLASEPTLIVVDNASSEDPEPIARAWRGRTIYVRNDRNLGFGAACNLGLGQAEGEIVVFLNPDTQLVDDGLTALAERAQRLPGLVGPRVLEGDGRPQPSASGPPTGLWPWARALMPGAITPDRLLVHTEPWRLRRSVEVAWLSGACIAAPIDAMRALGGFDESIELFAEDMDLCLRARAAGVRSYFVPDVATIIHTGDVSMRRRFDDAGVAAATAASHRRVLTHRFGARAAKWATRAIVLNLSLRVAAKSVTRSATRDRDLRTLRAFRG